MLHKIHIVTLGEILAVVAAAGFLAVQGPYRHDFRQLQQEAQFHSLQQIKVKAFALVLDGDVLVAFLQLTNDFQGAADGLFGAEHLHVGVHGLLQVCTDSADLLGTFVFTQGIQQTQHAVSSIIGNRQKLCGCGVFGRFTARTFTEHVNIQQRVGA